MLHLRLIAPLTLEADSHDDDSVLMSVTGADEATDPRSCEQVAGIAEELP